MHRTTVRTLLTAALLAVAFVAGLGFDHAARAARKDGYRPLDVFSEALAYIENNYVEPVPEKELAYAAIDGMMGRLDPHSQFMRPEVVKLMKDETTGEFDGLGIELTIQGEQLTVIAPMSDSPGERAGIKPGDRIVKIDGAPTRDLQLMEAIRRLKGPAGSKVTLDIMRDGFQAPQSLTLLRDHVRTQSVEWKVIDAARGVVHVRVKQFQDRTDRALKKALDDARAELKGEIRGLVLDLRNDPGGLLDQAVKVADRFLASGVIVSTEGRDKRSAEVERAHEKGTEPPYPMIVLVNKGSASASEVVAGALQDHGRAVIMGTQTFGKGSVQTIIDLEDGSGIKLTIARYFTPKHRSIQELGITPDVVVPETAPAARAEELPGERDLKGHFKNDAAVTPPPGAGSPEQDNQLRTALDYLRAVEIFKAAAPARQRPVAARQ
ncbi:S41 family peptidase [Anaeromyxobacter paludicola]|uniref:Peptidase S41 n=1 Tax=Anaeromyxobacter paludicola TaxID=2918171 RepID=A0ABM7XAZ2_9BACT|nr:S41 family peptidase [Anaeromyxobacter paludicola]BDG09001.1 peptidase S41 [Anaeromyxobacter paludicola]